MQSTHIDKKYGNTILFWFGITFTLSAPMLISILLDNSSAAWIAVTCGSFVTLMARFDNLTEFSLGPLRAKMQEKISEANATIQQLRKLAVTSANATLTELMASNFFDGTTLRTRLDLHDQFIETLRKIGVPELEIKEADTMWQKGIGIIYHRGFRKLLKQRFPKDQAESQLGKILRKAVDDFQDLLEFESWTAPSPERVQKFLNDRNVYGKEESELVSDYQYFQNTGEIRRRDIFVRL